MSGEVQYEGRFMEHIVLRFLLRAARMGQGFPEETIATRYTAVTTDSSMPYRMGQRQDIETSKGAETSGLHVVQRPP